MKATYSVAMVTEFRNPDGKKLFHDRIQTTATVPIPEPDESDDAEAPPKVPEAVYAALKKAAVQTIIQLRQDPHGQKQPFQL